MDGDLRLLPAEFEDVFHSDHDLLLRSPFRLFDLPPELWLRICELAVIKATPIQCGRESRLRDSAAIVRQPAIIRTCRLLRREGLPIFYAANDFEMVHSYNVPCPRAWLAAIGARALAGMRTLTMHSNCQTDFWEGSFLRAGIQCHVEFNKHRRRREEFLHHRDPAVSDLHPHGLSAAAYSKLLANGANTFTVTFT